MSYWTYVNGVITVEPLGRTQPEKRYILETILDHLPKVTGSERDMNINIVQKKSGGNCSCSSNEFGEWSFNGRNQFETYEEYMLIIDGAFRDRMFDETLKELNKFLNRLAKRVYVKDILVKLRAYEKELIISNAEPYKQMEEGPSWWNGEPAWAEYLMWDRAPGGSEYPLKLAYKHYNIPEIDAEIERRRKWESEEPKEKCETDSRSSRWTKAWQDLREYVEKNGIDCGVRNVVYDFYTGSFKED